ncbi:hypothetical protein Scep_012339 [Stephania cephalantha]|uniref:Uncharacterized protein n=1 Tax=Stephania cephalantha TaxID=152367 RepID=A0AAP0JGD7_9MAGN
MQTNLQRRRQELNQATPDQQVDDEAVYYNVPGECPRGRVYGLGSLGRNKRRYADPGASTSNMLEMVPRSEFDSVAKQLRQVVAFMQRQFGMTMVGAGLSHHSHHHHHHHHHHHLMSSTSRRKQIPLIRHSNMTLLIGRCKIGLRDMSSFVILGIFLVVCVTFEMHPQGVVGGGASDGAGPVVVFSGLEILENQLDSSY